MYLIPLKGYKKCATVVLFINFISNVLKIKDFINFEAVIP